jgi:hypothetical protein
VSIAQGMLIGLYEPSLALLVCAWLIVAVTFALRNGDMEKPSRVAQLYGYSVCLIALVAILILVPNLIGNLFRLADPLTAGERFGPALTSLDAYKATYGRGMSDFSRSGSEQPRPSEDELRRQYEALRADRIAQNTADARQGLVTEVIMLAISGALFMGHWRWLRRQSAGAVG